MSFPCYVLGVDIGGTKTQCGAVAVQPEGLGTRVVVAERIPTPRAAPAEFYDAIAELARRVQAGLQRLPEAERGETLPLLAVAHPGRFLPDGRLARGTTPNLGTASGQFDGLSPAQELERRLAVRVIAENDAVAQMRFGLDALLRDASARPKLVGEIIVYLGPGTGMGGGVARVGDDGAVTPVTDGHFFDLAVPELGDGTLTAEELFTGPAIARRVAQANARLARPIEPARGGRLDELLADSAAPPDQRAVAREIAREQGELLARLIETIHAGGIVKVRLEPRPDGSVERHVDEPDRAWSEEDKAIVRGARRYLFGGFVGTSRWLGREIRARALERLVERGLNDIEIFQIPVDSADAGVLGIVRAIPAEEIQRAVARRV